MTMMHNRRARDRAGRVAALSLGASLLASVAAFAWPVGGGSDVTIDNLAFKSAKSADGDSFAIAHVEFTNTNLSKEEIVKLLTPETPVDEARALAKKLTADKISIPSIDILGKDGSKIHLAGLTAAHVDAGRVESLDASGLDATGTDKGSPVTVKTGALHVDGVDGAQLLAGESGAAAKPSRLGGLKLSGLDVVAPDPGDTPGQTIHFSIGSIELHNDYAGDALKQGDSKITGIVIEPSPGSDTAKSLATLGYSKVELAVAIGASYQADAKSFTLNTFTVDGVEMGSVGVKANFTDVGPALFGGDSGARMQALLEAGVASVELTLVNSGLFDKALGYYAKQQSVAPDQLRAQWSATVGQLTPVMLGGSPSGVALAAEAQKFIAAPKNLTVTVKAKTGALKAGDFMALTDPTEIVGKIDISAAANR